MLMPRNHLSWLENEAIFILRECVAEAQNPVLLFSGGKDSTVLAHLAVKAFYPSRPPMPLLHVDSTWEFQDVLDFRDGFAKEYGFELRTHRNEEGHARALNPIEHGEIYTSVMRTEALRQALTAGRYDVILGGARRDEEGTRAKERIVSVRDKAHGWDPRNQRPEIWTNYNLRRRADESFRVFPLSNWTEQDLWAYIHRESLALCPLYFAAIRPTIERSGQLIVVDDARRAAALGFGTPEETMVRFRSLGCWPVTAAVRSVAAGLDEVVMETLSARISERSGRVSDASSLEAQKREGYF
jgi:sulfate adenylyltransferase subunit 2